MKRWFINEFKMLSYNSCSLTTWSLILQNSYSIDLWCPECPGSPGAEPASLQKAATQPANKTWLNADLCLDRETLPTAHHKSINSTQRQNHFYITAQQSWKRDMTKTSSVSQLCFQELLCSVMKGAQLFHRNTALPGLHKFLKCKISLTSTPTL